MQHKLYTSNNLVFFYFIQIFRVAPFGVNQQAVEAFLRPEKMALGALRGLKTFRRVSVEGVVEAVSATYRATAKNKSEFQLLS